MKTIISITTALLIGATLTAQSGIQGTSQGFEIFVRPGEISQQVNEFGLTRDQFNAIKDKMYANSKFLYGNIYENGIEQAKGLPMRYNAYTDDIEVKLRNEDEKHQPLIKDEKYSVKTLTEHYIYLNDNGSKATSGFMNVLVDGENYKLYKKVISTFNPSVKAKTSYDNESPASFNQQTYYYLVQNGSLNEISGGKSKMEKMLDGQKPGIRSWIKKEKLNVKDEKDLKTAVEHMNKM